MTRITSRINKNIVYPSVKTIDPEDFGTKSNVYDLDVLGLHIAVLIGVPKYTYTDQGVVYFPIYAVSGEKVRSQIGVFELKSTQIINSFKDGELDISMLDEPLLYDFTDLQYLGKLGSDIAYYTTVAKPIVSTVTEEEKKDEEDEDEKEDPFQLKMREKHKSEEKEEAKTVLKEGIFEETGATKEGSTLLQEETEKDAKEINDEYKEGAQTTWIEKYFKNNHYRIHDCEYGAEEGDGDCFFAAIVAAYQQIGKKTTVKKLRAILADEMTEDIFKNYRSLYLYFDDQSREIKKEMELLRKAILENKKRIKATEDKTAADNQLLLTQSREMAEKFKELEKQMFFIKQSQKEYVGVLENVDSSRENAGAY